MRVLLTGATGFIGSHTAELLLQIGWEVVCPVRNPSALRYLDGIPARIIPVQTLTSEVVDGRQFDYVIHLAGATRAPDYKAYYRANVQWTLDLLRLFSHSRVRGTLKRFVLVGSQAAVGPSPDDGSPLTESVSPCPISLYGRSKLEAENVALTFKDQLPITIVRPPTVFGPRDSDVLGVFRCARYRLAPCLTGPDRLVSLVYVQDLAEGILAACLSPKSQGEIYFMANPEPVVWREFTLEVARIVGCKAVCIPVPLVAMKLAALAGDLAGKLGVATPLLRSEKLEEMKQLAWVCSSEKAYKDLDWRPKISISEAIERTATWYKEHGWI